MFKKFFAFVMLMGLMAPLFAGTASAASGACAIPKNGDKDGNGYADAGVRIVCNYKSYYAEDASGNFFWDLGDGRIQTSGVDSAAELDQSTLTQCFYNVHARGYFNNDSFMESGEISNNIRCVGPEGTSTYNYMLVSSDHPRYTGNPEWAEWGDWEYVVYTESGRGNLVARPQD